MLYQPLTEVEAGGRSDFMSLPLPRSADWGNPSGLVVSALFIATDRSSLRWSFSVSVLWPFGQLLPTEALKH